MYSYGKATNSVGGREGVPLPTTAPAPIGHRGWTVCKCGLRKRPTAFHICIDLSADEPQVQPKPAPKKRATPKPQKTPAPKPRAARKTGKCACGADISKSATSCRPCEAARRKAAGYAPKPYVGRVGARIDEAVRRYNAGESTQQIADDFGATPSGVRLALRRAGVAMRTTAEIRRGTEGKRALSEEQAAEAARLYLSGLSSDAVAKHFGISQHAVLNTLRRLEVPMRRRGSKGVAA
jgi:uncharacterized protein (DUF433 family)